MKRFSIVTIALILATTVFAAQRTPEQAAAIAAQFTNNQPALRKAHQAPRTAASMQLVHTATKPASTEAAYYVFNQENNAGAIFISADDRTLDVLGYTDNGSFDPENINPNLRFWLSRYAEEIAAVNDENAYEVSSARNAAQTTAIGPLLKNAAGKEITWYQEAPYYNNCPMDERDNTRCLTGCVATAASQIMYKWRHPAQGTGSHSYTWYDYLNDSGSKYKTKTLTANFGSTTYDWDNMLPAYEGKSYTTAQANAVATLMNHAGIACEMMYGGDATGGSGAWTDDMGYGLVTYFNYSLTKFITMYSQSAYRSAKGGAAANIPAEYSVSSANFTAYFNADLEAGRPIIMGGEDSDGGGHEFVCDGRDTNGKFHINWGWEGSGNGYYALTSLKPNGTNYNFSTHLDALIGLQPAVIDTVHVTGVTVTPTSATININGKQTLTANITPADATVKAVTWTSANPAVATVSATGQVKGVAAGTTTITATTQDGRYTAHATITVTSTIEANTVFELVTNASALQAGDEVIFVCTSKNMAATNISNKVMGTEAVTITNNTIELPEGSEVVVLTLGGTEDAWTFTYNNKLLGATGAKQLAWGSGTTTWSIAISDGDATIKNANTTYGSFRYNITSPRFTTYTSNPSTTLVLPQIYARSAQSPTPITPVAVTGVTLSQNTASLLVNSTLQLTATVLPQDATNKQVTWSSSNTTVATVEDGVVSAHTAGTAVITVKTADGNHTATCTITVSNDDTPVITSDEFVLVTNTSKLAAGDEIILVCSSKSVAATNISNSVMGKEAITISDNTITLSDASAVTILTLGGKSDAWTFTNSSGKMLGATDVKKLAWGSGTTTWKISIASNNATIQSTTSSCGRFLYNVNSPRFTTYTSNTSTAMLLPQIFSRKKSGPGTGCQEIEAAPAQKAQKYYKNGHIVIVRDGETFNILGQKIK